MKKIELQLQYGLTILEYEIIEIQLQYGLNNLRI